MLLPNANQAPHFISGGFGPRARRPARCGPLDGDRCPNGGTAVVRCVDSGNSRDGWVYGSVSDSGYVVHGLAVFGKFAPGLKTSAIASQTPRNMVIRKTSKAYY